MATSRHREPIVSEHDKGLEPHLISAKATAKKYGHDPVVWRLAGTTAELHCANCSKTAGVALHPPPGGKNYDGQLVTEPCR